MKKKHELDLLKNEIQEYLCQKGINLKKPFICLNPLHEDENPSMSYNLYSKSVHCFSCGISYDVFDLIGLDYNIEDFNKQYYKACELFAFDKLNNYKKISRYIDEKQYENSHLSDKIDTLTSMRNLSDGTYSYFISRGLNEEFCEKYGFFIKDKYAYMPIYSKGICTGWCSRAIDANIVPRYKNSFGFLDIWNGDILRSMGEKKRFVYVTEGIFDASILVQLGYEAISLCGSQSVSKLIRLCKEYINILSGCSFILCGDPDEAGKKMNELLSKKLSEFGYECYCLATTSDISEMYTRSPEILNQSIRELYDKNNSLLSEVKTSSVDPCSISANLDSFLSKCKNNIHKPDVSTGFKELDEMLGKGLRVGVYVIGAATSIGKTSFVLQIADYISESKRDVIFFSLEQSKSELIAKSMSRISNTNSFGFTAMQLLSGEVFYNEEYLSSLEISRKIYFKNSLNLFIYDSDMQISLENICKTVEDHIKNKKQNPVVIIDYLQLIKSEETSYSDKQNVDRTMQVLSRLSHSMEVSILAVSSFNRENYKYDMCMEAFKESGAIEYCADVVMGLQLLGTGKKDFNQNVAKLMCPRHTELVILKNRNGVAYGKLNFSYNAKYNLFQEEAKRIDGIDKNGEINTHNTHKMYDLDKKTKSMMKPYKISVKQ